MKPAAAAVSAVGARARVTCWYYALVVLGMVHSHQSLAKDTSMRPTVCVSVIRAHISRLPKVAPHQEHNHQHQEGAEGERETKEKKEKIAVVQVRVCLVLLELNV